MTEENKNIFKLTDDGETLRKVSKEADGKVIVPFGVKDILGGAFADCKGITSVFIPRTVEYIGIRAFSNCSNLETITIPFSVRNIKHAAFEGCESLEEVRYEGTLEHYCRINFESMSSNPCSQGANLIIGNDLVTEIRIPSTISEIKKYAFTGCASLTKVTFHPFVTDVFDCAFCGCHNLKEVDFPGRTCLYDEVFMRCRKLSNVSLSDEVIFSGSGIFGACYRLKHIKLPNTLESLPSSTFFGCLSLQSVEFGSNIKSIGSQAFRSTNLRLLNLPPSLEDLQDGAFSSCNKLRSVYIPASVTTVEPTIFSYSACALTIYCESCPQEKWHDRWNVCDGDDDSEEPATFSTHYNVPLWWFEENANKKTV